jgi:hypothetical protein
VSFVPKLQQTVHTRDSPCRFGYGFKRNASVR